MKELSFCVFGPEVSHPASGNIGVFSKMNCWMLDIMASLWEVTFFFPLVNPKFFPFFLKVVLCNDMCLILILIDSKPFLYWETISVIEIPSSTESAKSSELDIASNLYFQYFESDWRRGHH